MSSVGPTHQASTVSGRTTIPTAGRVPVLSLARCAGRASWRRSCCCSVSIAIGGYCSSGRTSAFHGDGIITIFFFFLPIKFFKVCAVIKMLRVLVILCARIGGFTPSARASTRRMRWNKLLMKALHAHTAPHMFQSLWVSVRTGQKHQVFKFENVNLSDLVLFIFIFSFFFLSIIFA